MSEAPFNEEYVRKLAAGDPDVQKHFFSYFTSLMRIKLRMRLRSTQGVDDICQETFVRVLNSLRTNGLRDPERLGGYVNSICHHVMLENFRADTRHRQMPAEVPDIVDDSADPTRDVFVQQRLKIVRRVLSEMPAKDRGILRMVFLEEKDKDRICKDMNVNPEYLRVLIHRAKAKFRIALDHLDPDGTQRKSL
ncbi:MAG: sigma-70 family RNA polymerase sigma factor [Acidobacteriaceae bacterium]|nr:sigma-70 family RNA polymerase sigma factor [Acidobacteriaceae bacterium]